MKNLRIVYDAFPTKVFCLWLAALLSGLFVAKIAFHLPLGLLIAKLYEWDGGWYLTIIHHGYPIPAGDRLMPQDGALAFFPVYPLVVGAVSFIVHLPPRFVGIALSWVFFFIALQLLYHVLYRKWGFERRTARFAVALLALNPFGFFFGMLYTESLFLLLIGLVLLFLSNRSYLYAAIFAGLASGTRNVGIFLAMLVVLAYMSDEEGRFWHKLKDYRTYCLGLLSASGLLAFMAYLYVHTGNALAFVAIQRVFGRSFALSGFTRDFQIIIEKFGSFAIWPYSLLAGIVLFSLGIAAGAWLLRQQGILKAYGAAAILTSLAPLTSGTFASMNRYQMIQFALYLFMSHVVQSRILRYLLLIGSILLFIGFTILLCHPMRPLIG